MRVLIVEPGQTPREADIDGSLKGMQKVVGGLIEALYPFEESVALICNEESKLDELPYNRALYGPDGKPYDVIAGTFFVCGLTEANFGPLSPELMDFAKKKFHMPESFACVDQKVVVLPESAN